MRTQPVVAGELGRDWSTGAHTFGRWAKLGLAVAAMGAGIQTGWAAALAVPNSSFESQVAPPVYPYVTTQVDSWQKTAKPGWFDETAYGLLWEQTVGLFQNTPVGSGNHIDNMAGNQGLYLLAFPQVGVFQDYATLDWSHATPTHDFSAVFQVGKSYQLSAGILGGSGGMAEGTSLKLGLYYLDGANNRVTISSTPIAYTAAAFPNNTHFIDYTVDVPEVQATDPWAGRYIGIELSTTSGTGAGYWDLDNVRLTEAPEPSSAALLLLGLGGLYLKRRHAQARSEVSRV